MEAFIYRFPIVVNDEHGTSLLGGKYTPEAVVGAYCNGIFPWPQRPGDQLWYSSDPRAILPLDNLYVSQRLARTIRSGRFAVSVDGAFAEVMQGCSERGEENTWITPELLRCYVELHKRGWAHSFEVWEDGNLVGGLYGLAVGGLYGAESMFHRVSDASKVAMAAMVQHCRSIGVQLIDLQVLTPHTERMGAVEISRERYHELLAEALQIRARWAI
jgi:leucyl/phenylalanyl-tRNA--protein transferase